MADTKTKKLAVINTETCAVCEACIPECPNSAIENKDGKIVVDSAKCDGCGTCKEACPTESITLKDR
jgi:ferredoxin